MRILFLTYNTIDSCSFYRSGGVAPDLARQTGYEIEVRSWKESAFHWQNLLRYDIIMMQRPYTQDALTMGRYVKELRIPLWIDHDDLLLALPRENRMSQTFTRAARKTYQSILEIADTVTVTSDAMRKELLQYNSNIVVIPNAHNNMIFGTNRSKIERKKLVLWRGSETHVKDIQCYTSPINKAVKEFPDHTFVFAGFKPWVLDQADNIEDLPSTDPIIYFQNMAKLAPKLMHVPLNDSIFNRCKSNIAYLEATYFGAVCLAPVWDEWSKPGILNYDSDQDYYEWISSTIKGEISTEKYTDLAWEYICDELLLSKVNHKRIEVINNLLGK